MRPNEIYQDIIAEVSEHLANHVLEHEHNVAQRATMIDQDIHAILQEVGRQTTQKVLETTRDAIVLKKKMAGMSIHKNPTIQFTVIFGTIDLKSPYLWPGSPPAKPLIDDMHITHRGRSDTVKRALSEFGSDESFDAARQKVKEHYHIDVGTSTVDRTTKAIALEASAYLARKLSSGGRDTAEHGTPGHTPVSTGLVELDGSEARTAHLSVIEESDERTPVYNNPKKHKIIKWRDIRLGFARSLEQTHDKIFVGKMDSYPEVIGQLRCAAEFIGMTSDTVMIGVADGGIGLSEELLRQFPTMQFILDKPHLRNHLYETAEKLGIDQKARATWVEPRLQDISRGQVDAILSELVREQATTPCHRVQRLIGYLTRFKEAVSYEQFKDQGYPIGSGEIESAHKSIPQKRLKLPGATWHPDSINPMLALRLVKANEWWDDFWEQRTAHRAVA
ncbi:MAG: hypothetical protein GY850_39535 [bacterium]|nr:hypothetical protein [bacterium]